MEEIRGNKPPQAIKAEEALSATASRDQCGSRESGRGVLLSHARRLRHEADLCEALARAIPDNFPRDADEALWTLAIGRR